MTITDEMRFPVRSHNDDWERPWREDENEHDMSTATVWCLHLEAGQPDDVAPLADKMLSSGAEILNGVYIGGDSFRQWAETFKPGDPVDGESAALHLYFTAPSLETARRRGGTLARIAYGGRDEDWLRLHCCISTAADWSLQAEIV